MHWVMLVPPTKTQPTCKAIATTCAHGTKSGRKRDEEEVAASTITTTTTSQGKRKRARSQNTSYDEVDSSQTDESGSKQTCQQAGAKATVVASKKPFATSHGEPVHYGNFSVLDLLQQT
uniref:Serine/threonine-protein kinase VRK1 n=1 Tax=Lygus hesperus TaxID=30085 RepID=A0A0A9YCW2_LYGHE